MSLSPETILHSCSMLLFFEAYMGDNIKDLRYTLGSWSICGSSDKPSLASLSTDQEETAESDLIDAFFSSITWTFRDMRHPDFLAGDQAR